MKWIVLPFLFCAVASGQSTLSTTDRFAYAANAGWIDLRPSAADGVRLTETCLSGNAYAANFGWIHFGDGTPSNGHSYSNASATDYGVNLAADGSLTGYAYAANVGWIALEQTQGKPKLNLLTGKITGHVHGANFGWIVLDTNATDLVSQFLARPDTDGDAIADAWEQLHFANLTTASGSSNGDGDTQTDLQEYEAGTDPKDAASSFRIVSQSLNSTRTLASIQFTSSPGRLYRVEHDADLLGPWSDSPLGVFAPDNGPLTSKQVVLPGSAVHFIRAVAIKPLQP